MSVEIGGRKKNGKTKYETMLQKLFQQIGVQPITDNYLCMKCGDYYHMTDPTKYPTHCKKCGVFDGENVKYIMPDLIVKHDNGYPDSVGIFYVNGWVHTKTKQKKKDEHQIERLVRLGYKVFAFENEDVQTLKDSKSFIAQAALRYIMDCIKFEYKYQQLLTDEEEMVGADLIRGCAPWAR